jgi:hypothetical protein
MTILNDIAVALIPLAAMATDRVDMHGEITHW